MMKFNISVANSSIGANKNLLGPLKPKCWRKTHFERGALLTDSFVSDLDHGFQKLMRASRLQI